MREAMSECWAAFNSSDCPLFEEFAASILQEAGRGGEVGDVSARDEMWQELQSDEVFFLKRYKCNTNRFWHGVEVGWLYTSNWTKFRLSHSYMVIESNSLNTTALHQLVFKRNDEKQQTVGESVYMEERALKGKINALACSSTLR